MVERVSAKRYGVRYGRKLREKVGKLDKLRLDSKDCPYCNYKKVKRVAAGIWYCGKCDFKFAGRAYSTGTQPEIKEGLKQEDNVAEEVETAEQEETLEQNG